MPPADGRRHACHVTRYAMIVTLIFQPYAQRADAAFDAFAPQLPPAIPTRAMPMMFAVVFRHYAFRFQRCQLRRC